MSVESLAAVLHHSRAKGTAKLVMVGIANHDGDGGAYPSVSTLARYANVDPRNVQRSIDKLVSLGELAVHVQQGGTIATPEHERTNRYDVLVSCPPWCDRTTQHRDTRQTRQPNLRGLSTESTSSSTTPRRQRHPLAGTPPVPPGASATPPGGASATQTIHSTQPPVVGTEAQHARGHCAVCARPPAGCAHAQSLTPEDRHDYVEDNPRAMGYVGGRRASG